MKGHPNQTWACVLSHFSCVRLFSTPWTTGQQAPLSMGFSRQEYWSGLPFPSPGDLPNPEIKPMSLYISCISRPEKAMAPHSSTLAWRIPWTEEPGRLQSMGSLRVGHDWSDLAAALADRFFSTTWKPQNQTQTRLNTLLWSPGQLSSFAGWNSDTCI